MGLGDGSNRYTIVFDDVILRQFKKFGKDKVVRERLSKMFDRIEELGPRAGKLIDSMLHLYEVKSKHPPIRLYYKIVPDSDQAYVFEYELKTSPEKQEGTIQKIKERVKELFNKKF